MAHRKVRSTEVPDVFEVLGRDATAPPYKVALLREVTGPRTICTCQSPTPCWHGALVIMRRLGGSHARAVRARFAGTGKRDTAGRGATEAGSKEGHPRGL